MTENKHVLIVECSENKLQAINENNSSAKKDYVYGGVFTEFGVLNNNERMYTAENFIPGLNKMLERKAKRTVLYGEWDHPQGFGTSLDRISHTIESVTYNKEQNRIDGVVKFLPTRFGMEARALLNEGFPIFVSSRAAGITDQHGGVKVNELFTYDAVADPGFSSAKLGSLNESMGYPSTANYKIYEMANYSHINNLLEDNGNKEIVTKNQMTEYSEYLQEQIFTLKSQLDTLTNNGKVSPDVIMKIVEDYENMRQQQDKLIGYLEHFRTTASSYFNVLEDKIGDVVEHTNYLAETVNINISFTEYLAENIVKTIEYSEYIAEKSEDIIKFQRYIAENVAKNIAFSEYIAEETCKNTEFGDYLAEKLDNSVSYSQYIAEHVDDSILFTESIAQHTQNNIHYSEYIAEETSHNTAYLNYIAEAQDSTLNMIIGNKLFENSGTQMPNMKNITSVAQYYNDGDDTVNIQEDPISDITTGDELIPIQPIEGQSQVQTQDDEGQSQDDAQGDGGQSQVQTQDDDTHTQPQVETQPEIQDTDLTFGSLVSVGDNTGSVIGLDKVNGIVIIKMDETGNEVQVAESKVTKLSGTVMENKESIKDFIGDLITETKKRKAAEASEPDFLKFLTDKSKQTWYSLCPESKEKINLAINESKEVLITESQILNVFEKALAAPQKSKEQILLEHIPSALKVTWEKIDEKYKNEILLQSTLHHGLNTPAKMEAFWESRRLENFLQLKESKTILNENVKVDDNLSTDYINAFMNKLKEYK